MTVQEIFEKSLHREQGSASPRENWIAVYQGKWLKLKNGKCLWNKPNHARSALFNAFRTQFDFNYHLNNLPNRTDLEREFKAWREQNITIMKLEEWVKL